MMMNREVYEELADELMGRVETEAETRDEQKRGLKLVIAELKRGLASLDTIDDEDDGDEEELFGNVEEEPN